MIQHEHHKTRDQPFVLPSAATTPLGPLKVFLCSGKADDNSPPQVVGQLKRMWEAAGAHVATASWAGGHKLPPSGDPAFEALDAFI